MPINSKVAAVAVIALGAALAGAYSLGRQSAVDPAEPRAALPAGHPQVPAGAGHPQAAPAAEPHREGRVQVDPAKEFVHFRVGSKNVKRMLIDGDRVWVGTTGGVIRYDTRTDEYKLFDVKSGLLSNGIFHVGKLGGRVVVGTYGGGMSLYDERKDQWQTFNIPEGLGDAFVYDVLQAKNGDVWVATWSGANRIRGGKLQDRARWDLYTVENTRGGLPNDWVYGLAEGKDGEIWLGTEGGLSRFKDGKWESWNHAKGLGADYEKVKADIQFKSDPSRYSQHHAKQKEEMGLQNVDVAYNPNYIVSLAVDREGVVWAGTWGGGLSRFDGKSWRSYTVADGLPANHVFMLNAARDGTLWVGTSNGLAKMKDGRFEVMTTADGLFGNAVFSMATSPDGNLWVGGYGGLAKIRQASR